MPLFRTHIVVVVISILFTCRIRGGFDTDIAKQETEFRFAGVQSATAFTQQLCSECYLDRITTNYDSLDNNKQNYDLATKKK